MKKRGALILLTWVGVIFFVRGLSVFLPGDPAATLFEETGTAPEILRQTLAWDRPFFGRSLLTSRPVTDILWSALWNSVSLGLCAFLLGLIIALPLSIWGASSKRGRAVTEIFAAISIALPSPWLGPFAIFGFTYALPLFRLETSLILPASVIAIGFSAHWTRLFRDRLSTQLSTPSVQAARGRGLGEIRVLLKYALIPASLSLAPVLGSHWGGLLAGAFITESVFDRPGLGQVLVQSTLARDLPMLEGAVILTSGLILLGTGLGELWIRLFDHRPELG